MWHRVFFDLRWAKPMRKTLSEKDFITATFKALKMVRNLTAQLQIRNSDNGYYWPMAITIHWPQQLGLGSNNSYPSN
jgi:hypothetical protein